MWPQQPPPQQQPPRRGRRRARGRGRGGFGRSISGQHIPCNAIPQQTLPAFSPAPPQADAESTAPSNPPSPPPATVPNLQKPFADAPDFSAPALIVKVGKTPVSFHVNESILCAASDYVTSALKPTCTEGNDRIVTLTDDEPDIFNIYLGWLYSGRIFAGS